MFTFSFDNFKRALLILLGLIICFEVGVSFIPEDISADVQMYMGMKIKNDRSLNPGDLDAIILGDCFFFAGVIPRVLDKELNIRSFNFATNRSQSFLVNYLLFKKVLRNSQKRPRLVIVGIHETSLIMDLAVDSEILRTAILPYFNLSYDLLNELPADLQMFAISHQIKTLVPSLKRQYLLRKNWPDLLLHSDREQYWSIEKSIMQDKGYINEDLGEHRKKRYDFTYSIIGDIELQQFNDYYIRKILALARKYGIKVVIVSNSYREDMAVSLRKDKNFGFDLQYYEKLKSQYANVIAVFDMHSAVNDPDRYVDETHLDNKGSVLFTEELARRLKPLQKQPGGAPDSKGLSSSKGAASGAGQW